MNATPMFDATCEYECMFLSPGHVPALFPLSGAYAILQ